MVERRLSDLVDAVRRDHANQDIDSDEEGEGVIPHRTAFQIAADRIASYEEDDVFLYIDDIHVDGTNDIDNDLVLVECLQALIESNRVKDIMPSHDVDTTTLTFVLDRIVSRTTGLATFLLPFHPDTTFANVEVILQSLRSPRSSPLLSIEVHYNKRWPLAITEALCDFIMSPSASAYTLALRHGVGCWISEEAFGRLCAAVQQAPDSLHSFRLQNVVINNMDVQEALSLLAHTCAGSPRRQLVISNVEHRITTPPAHCTFQLDEVRRALLNLEAVKDSELFITFVLTEDCLASNSLPCWWRLPGLLTLPLEEWPAILVDASQHDARLHEQGNGETSCSHSSLDILFFLMKAKNDVLLPSAGDNNRDDV